MEIQGTGGVQGPRKIQNKKMEKAYEAAAAGESGKADSVEFSDMSKFLDGLSRIPGVRNERVQQIRAQIEKGEYETPEKLSIAIDRLLEDLTD